MNHLHQKRPRPMDSPRGPSVPYGYPQPEMYMPAAVPLPSSPTAMQGQVAPPYMQAPPTSTPHIAGNAGHGHGSSSSSFRNVSACNRCRLRKNRCDQNLPACSSCEKARVKCVGYDPITKREIPRAYVYYLERRVGYLEGLLQGAGIAFAPAEDFDVGPEDAHSQPAAGQNPASNPVIGPVSGDIANRRGGFGAQGQSQQQQQQQQHPSQQQQQNNNVLKLRERSLSPVSPRTKTPSEDDKDAKDVKPLLRKQHKSEQEIEDEKLDKLVSNIGMVSVQGASDPRYLGSASGISFARVVFAAVRSSISGPSADARSRQAGSKGVQNPAGSPSAREGGGAAAAVSGSMRDSFFGLQSRPAFKKAAFPDRELATRLVDLYFEHANTQIPILHRGEFFELFEKAFAAAESKRTARELYLLNIVFAIGASIFLGRPDGQGSSNKTEAARQEVPTPTTPAPKRFKFERIVTQPEEYHASAMANLEGFLSSASERPEGFGGALEELQAVLLLAEFALHRPVAPGLWYIVGVATRLAVDLGLHHEDGNALGDTQAGQGSVAQSGTGFHGQTNTTSKERGRREWVRDLRRRLWWCVYSFDRLVSTCVGRPFGITDLVVTTEFPSILDDKFITKSGFIGLPEAEKMPSYKHVSHHYFKLRLLQSEILQVLQHRSAQQARRNRTRRRGPGATTMHDGLITDLQTPFLQRFNNNFGAWRKDVDRRLYEWKEDTPSNVRTDVDYTNDLLELHYWQTVIMLYRHNLAAPSELHHDGSVVDDVTSPMPSEGNRDTTPVDEGESEDDIYLKVAEAGQNVLKLYRQLHRVRLVNYTFLATHHLFMAGIAFLYALWHSQTVRSMLTFDDVDFTVLAATSVLTDLIPTCPPAEACRDAFDRMAKATVTMCFKTTGFGSALMQQQQAEMQAAHMAQHAQLATPAPTEGSDVQIHPTPQLYIQDDNGQYRGQRPRPHFDMNLRELFPEETPESQQFRRVSVWQVPPELGGQPDGSQQQQQQQAQQPQQAQQQPLGIPNMNFGADPVQHFQGSPDMQQAHAQQQQERALLAQLQQQQQNAIPIHQAMAAGSSAFPGNNPNFTGPGGNGTPNFDPNMGAGFGPRNDMESLLADETSTFSGQPGLSLGYTNEHDWNDGAGVDIFDGYFFGGWNGGAGMPGVPNPGMGALGMPGPQGQAMDLGMDDGIGPKDV